MKRYALLLALAAMLCGTEAGAANIDFTAFSGGIYSPPFTQHIEDGFLTTPLGPDGIFVVRPDFDVDGNPIANTDNEFNFDGIDLTGIAGSVELGGGTTYIISGFGDVFTDAGVFQFSHTVYDSEENVNGFKSILTSSIFVDDIRTPGIESVAVNSLSIGSLTITAVPRGFSADNIRFHCDPTCPDVLPPPPDPNVPEPASLLLLGAGLAGIGIWRRKAAR
jgi:PEP-CTERM motif